MAPTQAVMMSVEVCSFRTSAWGLTEAEGPAERHEHVCSETPTFTADPGVG